MSQTKKDYIDRQTLNSTIIKWYREGRTVKNIAKACKHLTIDRQGGHCRSAMLSRLCMSM